MMLFFASFARNGELQTQNLKFQTPMNKHRICQAAAKDEGSYVQVPSCENSCKWFLFWYHY